MLPQKLKFSGKGKAQILFVSFNVFAHVSASPPHSIAA